VIASIPRIVVGLVVALLALIVASIAERMLRIVMVRLRFDDLIRRSGVDQWIQRAGIRRRLDDVIPRLVFFVLLFLFAREGAESLGLVALSEGIAAVMAYLPSVISAFLIVLIGGALAQVAGHSLEGAARGLGVDFAPSLGRLVTGILLFLVAVTALSELRVDTVLVRNAALLLLGGACLAGALSLGLGSRDITRNVLAGFYARRTLKIGQQVEVAGRVGTVEALTPTQIHLRSEGRTLVFHNAAFLEGPVSPAPPSERTAM
jgi:hypothetical protein